MGESDTSHILIKGAREHNLRIDELRIPHRRFVVFTGVSGSGKSSLAFDTLYAEGQRRYVESLSSYARQFLGMMEKPKVEKISGLSPTIAIEQKSARGNPRSTVGTITEVYDYFRVLWARIGAQHCPRCGVKAGSSAPQEVAEEILRLKGGTCLLLAPLVDLRKGEHREILDDLKSRGFVRVRIDGTIYRLDEDIPALDKKFKHSIELVVDRIRPGREPRERIEDSVEIAFREGKGRLLLSPADGGEGRLFSTERSCPQCGQGFEELEPHSFSFNHPLGMCPDCHGLSRRLEMDPGRIVQNPALSIREGAVKPWATAMGRGEGWTFEHIRALEETFGVDLDKPWARLSDRHRRLVLYGTNRSMTVQHGNDLWTTGFEGIVNTLMRRMQQTGSEAAREYYQQYLSEVPCTTCGGERLKLTSRHVRVGGRRLPEVVGMSVEESLAWFRTLKPDRRAELIAGEVLKEIRARLEFLENVGLSYLTLDRGGPSLSGGEAQRIRLASQLGSELVGVMYVLDEPSIGLHSRDNRKLLDALLGLRDLGNTVIVVEHDRETIESAEHLVDFGPGAGREGGRIVAQGTPAEVSRIRASVTGDYLAGRRSIEVPAARRKPTGWLTIRGASMNNLKGIDAAFPLGVMTAVTGVSGAGKSSLVTLTLLPALERLLNQASVPAGPFRALEGMEQIDKVIEINQQPIGRTPRSNPATYTKAFDLIRELFARTPEARAYGYDPGRFSFNVRGGRCDACEGAGVKTVEMHFLAPVHVPCEVCRGKRYNDNTLRVRYRGRNIREVLDTTVVEAMEIFSAVPKLSKILRTLNDVGLGYVELGQPATTLSGGEAQRIKLSRELARRDTGRTLYVLDEPTTGLHFEDIRKLLDVLYRLVDAGNTVVIIEHNLDVVKCADHVIDLGPEGGDRGGEVVATGTPEEVGSCKTSWTGEYLKKVL